MAWFIPGVHVELWHADWTNAGHGWDGIVAHLCHHQHVGVGLLRGTGILRTKGVTVMKQVPGLTKEDAVSKNEFHLTHRYGTLDGCRKIQKPRSIQKRVVQVRRNGRTQTWKTRPEEWRVPVKYGIRAPDQFSITQHEADNWHTPEQCPVKD